MIMLVDERQKAGEYEILWNGKDKLGKEVSFDIYYYELNVGEEFSQVKKMVLIR